MPFTPSSIEKTAPHFGHFTFVSFVYVAHPTEKTAKIANAKKMLTHFLITIHLLSSTHIYVGGRENQFYELRHNVNWIPKIFWLVKRKINFSSPHPHCVNGIGLVESVSPNLFPLFCGFLGGLHSCWKFHFTGHTFSACFTPAAESPLLLPGG